MSKYFKTIGFLSIISFISARIYSIIEFFILISKNAPFESVLSYFLLLLLFIIAGPAIGLLFISHSQLLEEKETAKSKPKEPYKKAIINPRNNNTSVRPKVVSTEAENHEPSIIIEATYSEVTLDKEIIEIGENKCNLQFIEDLCLNENEMSFLFYTTEFIIKDDSNGHVSELYYFIKENSSYHK